MIVCTREQNQEKDTAQEGMINSNTRKLALSGWLKNKHNQIYKAPLRMQKFLFFYESFAKIDNDKADFSYLRGYIRGPVFSNVWGDYMRDRNEFDSNSELAFDRFGEGINGERAKKAAFLVSILTEDELSDLTHQLNIWKCKEKNIRAGEQQVSLHEEDFSRDDCVLINALKEMYSIDLIDNSVVFSFNDKNFVISRKDLPKISEHHADVLFSLAENEQLKNPVFVELEDNGEIIID